MRHYQSQFAKKGGARGLFDKWMNGHIRFLLAVLAGSSLAVFLLVRHHNLKRTPPTKRAVVATIKKRYEIF
jgi:hypothetical protein